MSDHVPHHHPSEPGYQEEGSNVRAVFYWVLGLFALTLAAFLLSVVFHMGFIRWSPFSRDTRPVSPLAQLHRVPPEPRLQSNPTLDMGHWRETEDSLVKSYGWIDAQAGVVRLPIERAMELVAKEGVPSRKGSSE